MTAKKGKFHGRLLGIITAIGLLGSPSSFALTCAPPNLDAAYVRADVVVLGQLVSASMSEDFSAQGEFAVKTVFKGSPPDKLVISTNIGGLTYCGPDLTIGQPYLVFLTGDVPILVWVNDPSSDASGWIENKLATP